jgi:hypothetical protein
MKRAVYIIPFRDDRLCMIRLIGIWNWALVRMGVCLHT